jgi:hypothetical protein
MRLLSDSQLEKIADHISLLWSEASELYDSKKYPPDVLREAKLAFSCIDPKNDKIESSLKWKWGHLGKENYPSRHRALVNEVQIVWPKFVLLAGKGNGTWAQTFVFWDEALVPPTRYRFITKAFLTHLTHSSDVPLIDQHNFRSFRWYLTHAVVDLADFARACDLRLPLPKVPSSLDDIIFLKTFVSEVCAHMGKAEEDLDKYMMMHGKGLKSGRFR